MGEEAGGSYTGKDAVEIEYDVGIEYLGVDVAEYANEVTVDDVDDF